jgi:predicted RND superfamily exporter protein
MLPESDSVSIKLKEFNNLFGEDGNLFFFGFQDPDFFTIEKFRAFNELKQSILAIDGVTSVLSVYDAVNLLKHDEERSFEVSRIFPEQMSDQVEMDSLVAIFDRCPSIVI